MSSSSFLCLVGLKVITIGPLFDWHLGPFLFGCGKVMAII